MSASYRVRSRQRKGQNEGNTSNTNKLLATDPEVPGSIPGTGHGGDYEERERKREKWVVVRDTTKVGREKNLASGLKVPRHCPFVLPVRVKHLTGIIEV
jgi:hypothetical protein